VAQARRRSGLKRTAIALAASLAIACSSGGRDALTEQHPKLQSIEGQRLDDANPYVLPMTGRITFFHCHWPSGHPIDVSLPPDATDDERGALRAALQAWQEAGLGLTFVEVERGGAIQLDFVSGTVETGAGQDTANTLVDCRIAPLSQQGGAPVAGAELVFARIRIARITNQDTQGHQRPLTPAELTGTALHELGHALGFQGHARHGDTVMVRETERIMHAGKDLLGGGGFGDASLRALYALPNGAVVASAPVDRCHTDLVDRMAKLAEANDLDGPFVRVGESAGRIFWRDAKHLEFGLVLARTRQALADPSKLVVLPERRVRKSLALVRDVPCGDKEN
jgi:hypothetical protein